MRKYSYLLLVAILPVLLFGHLLIFPTIGIDTEVAILDYEGLLVSWESLSRIGLVALKRLFFPTVYSLVLNNSLLLVLLSLLGLWLGRYFSSNILVMALVFFSIPITYFQIYFQLQSLELVFGMCLVLLAGLLLKRPRGTFAIAIAIILMGGAVSIYQSFFDFLIAVVAYQLLTTNLSDIRKWSLLVLVPVGSLGIYWGVNALFNTHQGSDYLVIKTFSKISLLAIVVIVSIVAYQLYRLMSKNISLIDAVLTSVFLSSPFITLAIVGHLQYRALFPTLPIVLGVVFSQLFERVPWSRWMIRLMIAGNLVLTAYLAVQNYRQYQDDVTLALMIKEALPSSDYRIQFVGKYQANRIPIILAGEPAGKSFFYWDSLPSHFRSDNMMALVGAKYVTSSQEQNQEAIARYASQPVYPIDGWQTIDHDNKVLIVKLGD